MKTMKQFLNKKAKLIAIGLVLSLGTVGCTISSSGHVSSFEEGYNDGFADDGIYFLGFDDSWFTIGFAPILYQGDTIPFIDDFSYDAGFFDGQFDAYNDGYFVAYRYAFIIGFSEGYDNAFWPDYLDFLANDIHPEFLNGGFSDGYNDGFSEGRIFGAFDFETGILPFDWLDAFLDWESGTDLYFEEIDLGTGVFGPVIYYEWGTDPHLLRNAEPRRSLMRDGPIPLRQGPTRSHREPVERDLTDDQITELTVSPLTSDRDERELALGDTWLDRIDAYNGTFTARAATREASSRADSERAR